MRLREVLRRLRRQWKLNESGIAVPVVRPLGLSRRDFLRAMGVTTTVSLYGFTPGLQLIEEQSMYEVFVDCTYHFIPPEPVISFRLNPTTGVIEKVPLW